MNDAVASLAQCLRLFFLACVFRSAGQSSGARMSMLSPHIDVTPDHAADTAKLLKEFAADSRKDPGVRSL